MDIKIQSLEHDKTDLQEEVKNRELDLTKSKLMIEKMRNEIDTLKMYEHKMDEMSGDCKDLNMRLMQARSQTEKDALDIADQKKKL